MEGRSLNEEFREMSKLSRERPLAVAVGKGGALQTAPQNSITLEVYHLQQEFCGHNSSEHKGTFSFVKKKKLPFLLHGQHSRNIPSYLVCNTEFSRKFVFQSLYKSLFLSFALSIQKATEVEDEVHSKIWGQRFAPSC